jgi:hypothetical protein
MIALAKVKSVKVEFGVSVNTGPNSWIKAGASAEIELDNPNDKTDEVYNMAWNRVVHEVNQQIQHFNVQVVEKPKLS